MQICVLFFLRQIHKTSSPKELTCFSFEEEPYSGDNFKYLSSSLLYFQHLSKQDQYYLCNKMETAIFQFQAWCANNFWFSKDEFSATNNNLNHTHLYMGSSLSKMYWHCNNLF